MRCFHSGQQRLSKGQEGGEFRTGHSFIGRNRFKGSRGCQEMLYGCMVHISVKDVIYVQAHKYSPMAVPFCRPPWPKSIIQLPSLAPRNIHRAQVEIIPKAGG